MSNFNANNISQRAIAIGTIVIALGAIVTATVAVLPYLKFLKLPPEDEQALLDKIFNETEIQVGEALRNNNKEFANKICKRNLEAQIGETSLTSVNEELDQYPNLYQQFVELCLETAVAAEDIQFILTLENYRIILAMQSEKNAEEVDQDAYQKVYFAHHLKRQNEIFKKSYEDATEFAAKLAYRYAYDLKRIASSSLQSAQALNQIGAVNYRRCETTNESFCQEADNAYDEAENLVRPVPEDKEQIRVYADIKFNQIPLHSRKLGASKDKDEQIRIYNELIIQSDDISIAYAALGNYDRLNSAHFNNGVYHRLLFNLYNDKEHSYLLIESINEFQKSISYSQKLITHENHRQKQNEIDEAIIQIALNYRELGRISGSYDDDNFEIALRRLDLVSGEEKGDNELFAISFLINQSKIYLEKGILGHEESCRTALSILKGILDDYTMDESLTNTEGNIWHDKGRAYTCLGDKQAAFNAFREAEKLFRKSRNDSGEALVSENLSKLEDIIE